MKGLIYNQNDIPKEQYRYGLRASAATGCGWVAIHNALCLLGKRTDTEELIRYLQWQLPLIHGNAGTTFFAPAVRMKKWGFPVEIVMDPKKFDDAARKADACILFYRWQRGYRPGAHFVALRHTDDGFVGYNTFKNSTGPDRYGPSIQAFLKKQRFFAPVLICIRDKQRKE